LNPLIYPLQPFDTPTLLRYVRAVNTFPPAEQGRSLPWERGVRAAARRRRLGPARARRLGSSPTVPSGP